MRRKRLVPLARKKKQQQSKIKEILSNENMNEFVDLALHIANYSTDIMYLNQVEYKTWLLTLIPIISILAPMLPIIIHLVSVVSLIIDGKFSQILKEIFIGVKMQIVFLLNI